MDWGNDPEDATPLTEAQREGLKLSWIASRGELNEAEADNILAGVTKWQRRKLTLETLLDDRAVRDLHRDLFGDVWKWAGRYRTEDLNIGVEFWQVSVAVRNLVDDAVYWFGEGSTMTVDEASARFHHRLVQIHPFPNGNGRHSREFTDLLLTVLGASPFTWGRDDLAPVSDVRRRYVRALQAADVGEFGDLYAFVRS
ncbi:mobile mystery protein B [Nocardioides sp. AN3]